MPAKIELDETLLVQLYQQGQSIYELGDIFGCNRETIRKYGLRYSPRPDSEHYLADVPKEDRVDP